MWELCQVYVNFNSLQLFFSIENYYILVFGFLLIFSLLLCYENTNQFAKRQ